MNSFFMSNNMIRLLNHLKNKSTVTLQYIIKNENLIEIKDER